MIGPSAHAHFSTLAGGGIVAALAGVTKMAVGFVRTRDPEGVDRAILGATWASAPR